jgi:V8-like Glu-specific endopeptidase
MANISKSGGGDGGRQPEIDETEGTTASPQAALQTTADGDSDIWTADEMEGAEPCDIIELDEKSEQAAAFAEQEAEEKAAAEGGGGASAGGMPDEDAQDESLDPQATSGGYNYPAPFTRHEVFTPYTQYPYRCVGKLFFRRNGRNYVCSASSVGNNAIWSAGHCLHAGNNKSSGWATNVVFVPAYRDGVAPYGQWQAKQLFVRTAWYKNGIPRGLCQDMGAAVLHKRNGKKISQVVGWLGFAWNWSKYQHWSQFGYPAAAPFNGRRLIANLSSFAYNGSVNCSPKTVGVGSDLTGGSSGGPWIMRFGTQNYVNGVNSYRRGNKPKEMFSPYFNNNARSLFNLVKNKN